MSHRVNGTTIFEDAETTDDALAQVAMPAAIDQGNMGISLDGATNLISWGFSGCMGVTVIPPEGRPGGMISHVHEGRYEAGNGNEYYREAVRLSIAEARSALHADLLGIVLTNGEDGGVAAFAGLAEFVQALPGVGSVLDLRPLKQQTGSAILWDFPRHFVFCFKRVAFDYDEHLTDNPRFQHEIALAQKKAISRNMNCLHWQ